MFDLKLRADLDGLFWMIGIFQAFQKIGFFRKSVEFTAFRPSESIWGVKWQKSEALQSNLDLRFALSPLIEHWLSRTVKRKRNA